MGDRGRDSTPVKHARFLILHTPETVERKKRILGSVIPFNNVYSPYENYVPYLDDPDLTPYELQSLEELSDFLWKEESNATVPLTNNIFGRSSAADTSAQAQVTALIRGSLGRNNRQDVEIIAGEAKRYTIDNTGRALKLHLVRNEPWLAQLNKFYKDLKGDSESGLCLVTGVYTCTDLEVRWNLEKDRQTGFGAEVPLGEMAGIPDSILGASLKLGFQVDNEKSDRSQVVAHCKKELVFALAYNTLMPTWEEPRQPRPDRSRWYTLGRRRTSPATVEPKIIDVTLGDPITGDGIDSYAGEDEQAKGDESIFYFEEAEAIYVPRPEIAREEPPETDNGHA